MWTSSKAIRLKLWSLEGKFRYFSDLIAFSWTLSSKWTVADLHSCQASSSRSWRGWPSWRGLTPLDPAPGQLGTMNYLCAASNTHLHRPRHYWCWCSCVPLTLLCSGLAQNGSRCVWLFSIGQFSSNSALTNYPWDLDFGVQLNVFWSFSLNERGSFHHLISQSDHQSALHRSVTTFQTDLSLSVEIS